MSKNQNKKSNKYSELEKSIIESKPLIKEICFALDDFSQQANSKKPNDHRSYVYALCEKVGNDLIPFYIGEGKGPRVWAHELDAEEQRKSIEEELASEDRLEELPAKMEELNEKNKRIHSIKDSRNLVKYIIKWGMTSKEAFMVESALINLLNIGGLKFDSRKLTNIVKGHQSEGEKQAGSNEAKTVEEFHEEYGKEPLYYEDLQRDKVKALLISINEGYRKHCLQHPRGQKRNKAIRETVCGIWSINEDRFIKSGIEYVFATYQARIIGIYKIKEVNAKKLHSIYEAVDDNSQFPHGEDVVSFKNDEYEFAKLLNEVANSKGKNPSQLELKDMPSDYIKSFKESHKKIKDFNSKFKGEIELKYMVLEDISKDDPNYNKFEGYMYRRIIHTDKYVEYIKDKKKKENKKTDKVNNNVFTQKSIRYIDEEIREL